MRSRLARATAVMAAGTTLSRLTGFGRVAALAYALGATRLADTYNLANTAPNIVYELVLGGVLSATLVPLFVDLLSGDDEDEAWRGVSAVVTLAAVVLAVLAALVALAAPAMVRVYTSRVEGPTAALQNEVATDLLRLFAPQILFYGTVSVATALLNARRRFGAPMLVPVLNNLVVTAMLLAAPSLVGRLTLDGVADDRGAVLLLGLGTTAGVALMAAALLPSLSRAGLRLRPVWAPRHPAVGAMLRLSGWTVGYVVANQVALAVVLALANRGRGDVSAYQYAFVFFTLPHGVVAVSVMTALQPELAAAWSGGDRPAFRRQLALGIRGTAFVLLPAAAGYVAVGRPLVSALLERGALSSASATTTADVLVLFALGLPAFSTYLLLMNAYKAMRDTRSTFYVNACENAINVVLAVALYGRFGVQGLALAYALSYTAAAALAAAHIRRKTGGIEGGELVPALAAMAAAAVVMGGAVAAVVGAIEDDRLAAVAGTCTGAVVYLGAARLLGVAELQRLTARLRPAVLRTGQDETEGER